MIERLRQVDRMAWLLLFVRVCLGGLFITSSIGKFQNPELFIDAVLSYDILPGSLAEFFGTVLPWVELFIGCSLILGIFSTFAAGISAALTFSFIIANIYSLFHPGVVACGCLGRLVTLSHPAALAIDFAMLTAAGLLLYFRDKAGNLGVGHLLARERDIPGLPASGKFILGVVIIVLAMIVAVSLMGGSDDSLRAEIDTELEDHDAVVVFFAAENPAGYEMIADLETRYQSVRFLRVYFGDDPQAVRDYDVETFPTVLVITSENKKGVVLEGPVDKAALTAAIEEALLPVTERPRLMYFWNGCTDCYGAEVDQVESLRTGYGDRVAFVEVDYLVDPSALSEYGVTDHDFTVLLLTWRSETNEYGEYTRFVGNLHAGTFSLTTIENGLEALLNAEGS
jgi:uncharacterized membrane protein YphA (DoxX/SURF4 family)